MPLSYQSGFGNEFATEAVAGALPAGQNSPQQAPLGLYAEQLSGSAFTAPRATNRRTWTYRIRPVGDAQAVRGAPHRLWCAARFTEVPTSPNQLRWSPFASRRSQTDFVDGLITIAGNGDPAAQTGVAIHIYAANRSMDGPLLLYRGWRVADRAATWARCASRPNSACSTLRPGEICVIPRGIKFRVELAGRSGARLRLRELRGAVPPAGPRTRSAPTVWPTRATS